MPQFKFGEPANKQRPPSDAWMFARAIAYTAIGGLTLIALIMDLARFLR